MKYLTLDLHNDHNGNVDKDVLIGVVSSPNTVPQVVACFPKEDYRKRAGDPFCLNEVERRLRFDWENADPKISSTPQYRAFLTRTSILTISGSQLAELQERGRLKVGGAIVRLVELEEETTVERYCAMLDALVIERAAAPGGVLSDDVEEARTSAIHEVWEAMTETERDEADSERAKTKVIAAIDASIGFAPQACRDAMLRARALLAGESK